MALESMDYLQSCPTQVVVIVEVKNQSSVIQSPGAGVVSQVEGAGVEAGFEQLAARDGHGAWTTFTNDGRVYERNIQINTHISIVFDKLENIWKLYILSEKFK